jgi:hypothetical protein
MKNKNEKLMTAFDRIDPKFIGEAMEYYGEKPAAKPSFAKRTNRFVAAAAAVAACLLIAALALPSLLIEKETHTYIPPNVREENTNVELQTPPEHDGTKGLIYEIREDGETARFVSFGSCTEETVVIATTYDGKPVVEMIMGPYWDHRNSGENVHMNAMKSYGSEYVKHLIISDTVEKFDDTIMNCCPNIESVYIGANVQKLRTWLFSSGEGTKIEKLEVSPDNEVYMSSGNCIIEKATKTLVIGCQESTIPADGSVEIIGGHAFSGAVGLTSIVIPDCVTAIEYDAFSWTSIESITLPANLQKMGSGVFVGCQNLVSVDLNGFTQIPRMTFGSCTALKEVKGSESIVEIADDGFDFCKGLESITFGKSLKKIGYGAFYACTAVITYEGTMAEWNAIEKNEKWHIYTDERSVLKKIICTDGEIVPIAQLPGRN